MEDNIAGRLQEKLVQCCIDFIIGNNIDNVDSVDFYCDNLEESIKNKCWHQSSDSSCLIKHYDGTRETSF